MSYVAHKLRFALFLFLLTFGQLLYAANLDTRHDPPGKLGVRLDYDLVKRAQQDASERTRRWIFSSYLVFKESTESITDGQIRRIAEDAFEEMGTDFKQYAPRMENNGQYKSLPGVMTIMAFDNKIILASSQRGASAFFHQFENNPLSTALAICAKDWHEIQKGAENTKHMRAAKCGEVSAFWLYYQLPEAHPVEIGDMRPLARVATVRRFEESDGTMHMEIMKPCGTDAEDEWGCNLLINHRPTGGEDDEEEEAAKQVNYLSNSIEGEQYDLKELAGGVEQIGQISACTRDTFPKS